MLCTAFEEREMHRFRIFLKLKMYISLSNLTCFLGLSVKIVCSLFVFVTCQTLKHTIRIKLKIDV